MKIIIILIFFCFPIITGCSTLGLNKYEKQIKIYEMQMNQGKIKAYEDALEASRIERIDVETQYQKKVMEYNLLITAFGRHTGIAKEQLERENALSHIAVMNEFDTKNVELSDRIAEINASYQKFYDEMKIQDARIESIGGALERIGEVKQKTYEDVTKNFMTTVGGVLIINAVPAIP